MNNNVFSERKNEKKINLKAIVCIMLASFMMLMTFAGPLDINAVAETVAGTSNASDSGPALEIVMDGTNAQLYFKNCIKLTSADFLIKLDPAVVARVNASEGEDTLKVQQTDFTVRNDAEVEFNLEKPSGIKGVFYVLEALCSSEEFSEGSTTAPEINGKYFHFATLLIELKSGYDASDIKISAECSAYFLKEGSSDEKINRNLRISVIENEPETEATTKPVPETTKPVPETTTRPVPETTTHTHKYSSAVTKKADCLNAGVKTFTCTCGNSYTEKIPSLGGHKLSWTVTKPATSFEEGIKEAKCKNCNYKEKQAIEKLPEIAVKPGNNEVKLSGEDRILALTGSDVKALLKCIPEKAVIQNADGKEAKNDAMIATGMIIVMKDASGKVVDTKTIVVPGDVDCDGAVSSSDARETLRKSVGLEELNAYRFAAADIEQDNSVSSSDARTILRASVGLENLEHLFKAVK